MFTESQLKEIEAYILENLPKLLEQDQRFALAVERIVSEKYAAKSDLVQILQEIKILREEMNLRFEASERRFEEMNLRFEASERRFEEMNLRFEASEHRFEALQKDMNSHFEAIQKEMNLRFEASERRFEALQKDMNSRFEALQREMNSRFEEMNQRFDEHDRRFDEHDRRIEANTRSIEALREDMNQRFNRVEQKFEDLKSWVGVVVGGFQRRAGQSLENAMAGMLRVALKRPDVREEMIQVRRKLTDHKGVMGVPGKQFEFDILVQDSEVIAFEVKSGSDVEMVEYFAQKRPIVESAFPDKKVNMVFITLAPDESIAKACVQNDVILAW